MAAEQGIPMSCLNLGRIYTHGHVAGSGDDAVVVPINLSLAKTYLDMAKKCPNAGAFMEPVNALLKEVEARGKVGDDTEDKGSSCLIL